MYIQKAALCNKGIKQIKGLKKKREKQRTKKETNYNINNGELDWPVFYILVVGLPNGKFLVEYLHVI